MRSCGYVLSAAALLGLCDASQAVTPAPKPTPKASASAPAAPKIIKLKWSTASEVDNYGFYIMRGDAKEGPFKQLNDKPIPGANNSDVPSKYEFEDPAVKEGRTYYYFIESISTQGVREKFSPVLSKVCCQRPEPPKLEENADPHAPKEASPEPSPSPSPSAP